MTDRCVKTHEVLLAIVQPVPSVELKQRSSSTTSNKAWKASRTSSAAALQGVMSAALLIETEGKAFWFAVLPPLEA